jgi:hypothetical protein
MNTMFPAPVGFNAGGPPTDFLTLKQQLKDELGGALKDDITKVVCDAVGSALKGMGLRAAQKASANGGVNGDDDDDGADADTEDESRRTKPKKMKGQPNRRSAVKNEFLVCNHA